MTKEAYLAMRNGQKQGQLREFDVTRFPRAFSYLPKEEDPSEAIFLGYELETYIPSEGTTTFMGISKTASKISKTKYGALCNFRDEFHATFELVSIPATLNFHRKSIEELLDTSGFTSRVNNGMHVHISKDSFKDKEHLTKFIVFVNLTGNRMFMEAIAGRKMVEFCAPNKKLNLVYGNSPDRDARVPLRSKLTFDQERAWLTLDEEHGTGKYCAINTSPTNTVELRIFLAPTTKDKIISNLEFTEALVKYTLVSDIKDLTVDSFVAYVAKNKKDLKYLYKSVVPFLPVAPVVKASPVKVTKPKNKEPTSSRRKELSGIGSRWNLGMPRLTERWNY